MKIIFKGLVEDVRNNRCTDAEVANLWYAFATAVVPFAKVSAKKPWYADAQYDNLVGFEGAKEAGIEEFSLIIKKTESDEEFDHFIGEFECDGKSLKVLAKIQKDQ